MQNWIKFFNKVIPDVIKLLVAPMLTVFISTVLLFTLVGPAGRILSNGITDGLMWSTEHLGAFGYASFAGVQQIVVITGLHHIIGAVEAQLIASTGTNFLNPLMSVSFIWTKWCGTWLSFPELEELKSQRALYSKFLLDIIWYQ